MYRLWRVTVWMASVWTPRLSGRGVRPCRGLSLMFFSLDVEGWPEPVAIGSSRFYTQTPQTTLRSPRDLSGGANPQAEWIPPCWIYNLGAETILFSRRHFLDIWAGEAAHLGMSKAPLREARYTRCETRGLQWQVHLALSDVWRHQPPPPASFSACRHGLLTSRWAPGVTRARRS